MDIAVEKLNHNSNKLLKTQETDINELMAEQ